MKLNPAEYQKIPIDFRRVNLFLSKSKESINASEELFKTGHISNSLLLSYESMLQSSTALSQSYGVRAKKSNYHYLMVKLSERLLTKKCQGVVKGFERLRKKRHSTLYDVKEVTKFEAEKALKTAKEYLLLIEEHIREKDPQKIFKL